MTPLLKDENQQVRYAALNSLLQMGAEATPAIKAVFKDLDESWRQQGIWNLMNRNANIEPFLPELEKLVAREKERERHLSVIQAMGRTGTAAVPTLTKLIKDERPQVRFTAVSSLGNLGVNAKSAASALTEAAKKDENARVRQGAIMAWAGSVPTACLH